MKGLEITVPVDENRTKEDRVVSCCPSLDCNVFKDQGGYMKVCQVESLVHAQNSRLSQGPGATTTNNILHLIITIENNSRNFVRSNVNRSDEVPLSLGHRFDILDVIREVCLLPQSSLFEL